MPVSPMPVCSCPSALLPPGWSPAPTSFPPQTPSSAPYPNGKKRECDFDWTEEMSFEEARDEVPVWGGSRSRAELRLLLLDSTHVSPLTNFLTSSSTMCVFPSSSNVRAPSISHPFHLSITSAFSGPRLSKHTLTSPHSTTLAMSPPSAWSSLFSDPRHRPRQFSSTPADTNTKQEKSKVLRMKFGINQSCVVVFPGTMGGMVCGGLIVPCCH